MTLNKNIRQILHRGVAIPASPLALNSSRKLDERRQRALCRYYEAAGAGGLAVGVHTTQFQIRQPHISLLEPVLTIAAEELTRADSRRAEPLIRIAGVCGTTKQAIAEACLARSLGYHAGLLSLAAMNEADDASLLAHCRSVADVIPVVGFYLQSAVGGRTLPYRFWREFAELAGVVAIKIAPFNRYQTLDVIRAIVEAGRDDIAIYTGNDDSIVADLVTPFMFTVNGRTVERRIVGGLLGHWSVWTKRAVELLEECKTASHEESVPAALLRRGIEVTDCNAAFFDAANEFRGCISGLHEVLHRQGLLEGIWCLDPEETLSAGQKKEIDRVYAAYPHLHDDAFVLDQRDEWLR